MENWEKSKHIARLTSDRIKIKVGKHIFFSKTPTRYQRVLAEEIYYDTLESAYEIYSEADLLRMLEEKKIWTPDDQEKLDRINKDIENLKVTLFENRLRYSSLASIRTGLEKSQAEADRLNVIRHSHDYLSRLTIAQSAKDRYLLGCSLFYVDGSPYWKDDEGWDTPDAFLTQVLFELNKLSLSPAEVREIARSEPWVSMWEMQKHCSKIFKSSPIELTDDQRSLVIWSSIYSSVRDHPDNLQDTTISDDDMLDGWMILKKREREKTHVKDEGLTNNSKIKNATEQFYMRPPGSLDANAKFGSVDEVKEFMTTVNSEESLGVIKQRTEIIKEKEEIKEAALSDVRLKNRIEQTRLLAEKTRQLNK